jgi:hypothetical protein
MLALCAQLRQLNGMEVTVVEKVDAGNIVGAATDGLVLIRQQFFPHGELEDGGGAVPPTAAGGSAPVTVLQAGGSCSMCWWQ